MYNLNPPFYTTPKIPSLNNPYRHNYHNSIKKPNLYQTKEAININHKEKQETKNLEIDKNNRNKSNNEDILFEILGLKIHFDDVLIICILLFLYQEGIQDEYLFISLILLLLS